MKASTSPALDATKLTIGAYDSARERYKPDRIMLLFIAESPPSSGGYFYFSRTIGKDHLFRETMRAMDFWPLQLPMTKGIDKTRLLNRFCSEGNFLIDTCELPVDKLSYKTRKAHIAQAALQIGRRVRDLNPNRIIIVKKTVYNPVHKALEDANLYSRILNAAPIPFPSHGNQKKYRTTLRRLLKP